MGQMFRWAVLPACLLSLTACDYGERITSLETRAIQTDQHLQMFQTTMDRQTSRVQELNEHVDQLARQVVGVSRLNVTITDIEWRTIYSNQTGRSQIIRLTHRTGGGGVLEVRRSPIPRPAIDRPDVPGAPAANPDEGSAPFDMSPVGAQRIQRLGCGQELRARTSGPQHTIDILIQADPRPISCDRRDPVVPPR
jgi:hypothetical protein